jgi:hypothetical protein
MRSLNELGKHFVCNKRLRHGKWYKMVLDDDSDNDYWLFRYYGLDASFFPGFNPNTLYHLGDCYCVHNNTQNSFDCSYDYDFHALCDKREVYSIEGISIDKVREILVDYEI